MLEDLDEYRYVYTLETLVEEARQSGRQEEAGAAQQLPDEIRNSFAPLTSDNQDRRWEHKRCPDDRRRLADQIVTLMRK